MLLENFRYAESTLSRDRLFALLGLASDGNEPAFEPDYNSPLEQIVLKFAQVFVRQGRGMVSKGTVNGVRLALRIGNLIGRRRGPF